MRLALLVVLISGLIAWLLLLGAEPRSEIDVGGRSVRWVEPAPVLDAKPAPAREAVAPDVRVPSSGRAPLAVEEPSVPRAFGRPQFVVELVAPGGAPWPGEITVASDSERRAPPAWPTGAHVQLVKAMGSSGAWIAQELGRPKPLVGQRIDGASAVAFDVRPGVDYLLSVIGMDDQGLGFDGVPMHVRIERDEVPGKRRVEAQSLPAFGALDAVVTVAHSPPFVVLVPRNPPADPVQPQRRPFSVGHRAGTGGVLQLEAGTTGVVLLEPMGLTSSPFRFDVPEGSYRLYASAGLQHPGSFQGVTHGGAHQDVHVTGSQVLNVNLDVGEGGVVVVDVGEGQQGVQLELVDGDGRRTPLQWVEGTLAGSWVHRWWPAGEVRPSQPIPAGHYSLVGHRGDGLGGGTGYDIPIQVEDGARVRVRVD